MQKKEPNKFRWASFDHQFTDKKLVEEDIASADNLTNPKLERLIFATTSSRDTEVQDIIRTINHDRKKAGKYFVDIQFWEDFQVLIENHFQLMYWYYSEVLESVHQYDKNIHILTMLRQAFTRPAFSRPIRREESGGDFIQAIKNTMETITTGKLYNRRGELITTSYDYKKITKDNWKKIIWNIYQDLDKIRDIYKNGVGNKSIIEHPTCLEVLDDRLADQFNRIRTDCLKKVNGILRELKLEEIKSELL